MFIIIVWKRGDIMDVIQKYGQQIKKNMDNPQHALNLIKFGLGMEEKRVTYMPDKNAPESLKYLNKICLNYILEPLRNSENYAWVNLFAPTEILHAMEISPMVIEAYSSFMSGLKCEDGFINYAEKAGISDTLCGYHKTFIGAVESRILPKPRFALTTSTVCDANVNTFRYISEKYSIPYYIIDVPYEFSSKSISYVADQLREAVKMIEGCTGKKLNEDKLSEIIENENSSKLYMQEYLKYLETKCLPTTLTLQMYMLFTSHTFMGRPETLEFYKKLVSDIKNSTLQAGVRVLWVHILPFYHKSLKEYFNFSEKYQILGYDMIFDHMESLDSSHPYEAIASKLINNKLNGPYSRKAELIGNLVDRLNPDAVINFCHWGCRQSSGGVMILRDMLKEKGIPFLTIDGDGVDRRNGHEGQVRTRLEAFFEMVEKNEVRK